MRPVFVGTLGQGGDGVEVFQYEQTLKERTVRFANEPQQLGGRASPIERVGVNDR